MYHHHYRLPGAAIYPLPFDSISWRGALRVCLPYPYLCAGRDGHLPDVPPLTFYHVADAAGRTAEPHHPTPHCANAPRRISPDAPLLVLHATRPSPHILPDHADATISCDSRVPGCLEPAHIPTTPPDLLVSRTVKDLPLHWAICVHFGCCYGFTRADRCDTTGRGRGGFGNFDAVNAAAHPALQLCTGERTWFTVPGHYYAGCDLITWRTFGRRWDGHFLPPARPTAPTPPPTTHPYPTMPGQ